MISFREVTLDDVEMLIEWRTKPHVTDFMRTDIAPDIDAQRRWIESCRIKADGYHWIVQHNDADIGLISFSDWDRAHKTASWGIYIGKEEALGFGKLIPEHFFAFCFLRLGLDTLLAEVFHTNSKGLQFHTNQGFVRDPKRDHVIQKGGVDIEMLCFRLERSEVDLDARAAVDFPVAEWAFNHQLQDEK